MNMYELYLRNVMAHECGLTNAILTILVEHDSDKQTQFRFVIQTWIWGSRNQLYWKDEKWTKLI